MTNLSKKQKNIAEKMQMNHLYDAKDALEFIKEFKSSKFNESMDISINLGVDPKKSDQVVRSSTNLPKGTGKTVRVAVFAQGDNAEKAKKAGADTVGFDDLAEKFKKGELNYDVVIATPDAMKVVGQLGTILGPKGLMPNPKVGTVTPNVEEAVKNAKSGQVRYRTDKNGIIHCTIGKVDFKTEDLLENVRALLSDIKKAKPSSSKGVYLKKITFSSTMGPGLPIDIATLPV